MGMFVVENGTWVHAIKDGKEWYDQNFVKKTTDKTLVFDKADLRIDPTGIGKRACGPNDVTVGSNYAKAGWYGFGYKGWTILVPRHMVQYG